MSLKSAIRELKINCKAKKAAVKSKAIIGIPAFLTVFTLLVGGASAESVLNTTSIIGIFEDLTLIFPAIGNFIIAVIPTLIMLAVAGFVLGFFDKILAIFDRVL